MNLVEVLILMNSIMNSITFFRHIVKTLQTFYFGNFGNAWLYPSKNLSIIFSKLSCLSAYKKSTASLMLQWNNKLVILGNFGMPLPHTPKMIVSTWNVYQQAKNKLHPSCFPWDIAKILYTNCIWYFGPVWVRTPKVILSSCRKPLYLSADKNSTSCPMLLWRYCKDMQTYFGYFGHAWLHSPKMIVSPCRRLPFYVHAKNTLHHLLLSFDITFYRFLQFDWLAAFWPITWDTKFCQMWWWNSNNNINLHFRLFQNDKIFQKIQKTQLWAQITFPGKRDYVSF